MGKKTNLVSDPALAKDHAAGAKYVITQSLTHDPLGMIQYSYENTWKYEADLASTSNEKLTELHQQIFEIPPGDSAIRSIYDPKLLLEIYAVGTQMVSHAVRSVQHLAQSIAAATGSTLAQPTASGRIREAAALVGIDDRAGTTEYQGFAEIVVVRDAIEHPSKERDYQIDPSKWDQVPLAWIISDRSLKSYKRYDSWFHLLATDWLTHLETNARPGELQIVQRGLKSALSAKKAPRGNLGPRPNQK